ncbi:MAG: hypothetical protein LBV43_09900 [Prevotella sp.]|jgi:hypothetical protein|nr:hypothetical protein [Prevotella sp.]
MRANKSFIENWIKKIAEEFSNFTFKYAIVDNNVFVVKYPDKLDDNDYFIKQVSNCIIDFSDRFENSEIIITNDSDDFFDIDVFEFVYGKETSIEKQKISNLNLNDSYVYNFYESANICKTNYAFAA